MRANIKPLTLVRYKKPDDAEPDYPFTDGEILLYIGEISNMPGHCAVATRDGKVHYGWHPEMFVPIVEE